ncbi:hypothetical protein JCM3766R1_002727 [Sporobolomyces carnicolor]
MFSRALQDVHLVQPLDEADLTVRERNRERKLEEEYAADLEWLRSCSRIKRLLEKASRDKRTSNGADEEDDAEVLVEAWAHVCHAAHRHVKRTGAREDETKFLQELERCGRADWLTVGPLGPLSDALEEVQKVRDVGTSKQNRQLQLIEKKLLDYDEQLQILAAEAARDAPPDPANVPPAPRVDEPRPSVHYQEVHEGGPEVEAGQAEESTPHTKRVKTTHDVPHVHWNEEAEADRADK